MKFPIHRICTYILDFSLLCSIGRYARTVPVHIKFMEVKITNFATIFWGKIWQKGSSPRISSFMELCAAKYYRRVRGCV